MRKKSFKFGIQLNTQNFEIWNLSCRLFGNYAIKWVGVVDVAVVYNIWCVQIFIVSLIYFLRHKNVLRLFCSIWFLFLYFCSLCTFVFAFWFIVIRIILYENKTKMMMVKKRAKHHITIPMHHIRHHDLLYSVLDLFEMGLF